MHKTKAMILSLALLSSVAPGRVCAQDSSDDQTMRQALEDARREAAKAGIKVPDASKAFEGLDLGEEKTTEPAKKKPESQGPAVTLPLTELPSWLPPIPGFQPAPNATKKQENGEETGKMEGTSSVTPEAIAEAWHSAATNAKLSFGRTDYDINGRKSVRITISDINGLVGNGEAELTLTPGKKTKVEIGYKLPLTTPTPAPQ